MHVITSIVKKMVSLGEARGLMKKKCRHKERMKSGSIADGTNCIKCGQDMELPVQWPRR